jgi:hypothetical protein
LCDKAAGPIIARCSNCGLRDLRMFRLKHEQLSILMAINFLETGGESAKKAN